VIGFFWGSSRVPDLNTKAIMGLRTNISAIAFDVVLPVTPGQRFLERVAKTTINWSYTNWKGMSFGLVLGAIFLSLLQSLPPSLLTSNRYLNSLKGMVGGVPLGVCVNCATPIAQSMHKTGLKPETVLATLMSSPTLNIIVLSMSVTLLPAYMVALKIAGSAIFITLIIPTIVTLMQRISPESLLAGAVSPGAVGSANRGMSSLGVDINFTYIHARYRTWPSAIFYSLKEVINNLWYIVKVAVPLMLLAGFLGAILVELLPMDQFLSMEFSVFSLLMVAAIAVFLPVPIAFDVIVTASLLAVGLAPGLAMAMMFCLGIFSIYPFMIIARSMSLALSISITFTVIMSAVILGWLAQDFGTSIANRQYEDAVEELVLVGKQRDGEIFDNAVQVCTSPEVSEQDLSVECMTSVYQTYIKSLTAAQCNAFAGINQELTLQCVKEHRFHSALDEAVSKNDVNGCKALAGNSAIDRCMYGFVSRLDPMLPSTVATCSKLSDPKFCRLAVIRTRIKIEPFKSSCELADFVLSRLCLYELELFHTVQANSTEQCMALRRPASRNQCLVATVERMDSAADLVRCDQLKSQGLVQACQINSILSIAREYGSTEICALIEDQGLSRKCIVDSIAAKIASRTEVQAGPTVRKRRVPRFRLSAGPPVIPDGWTILQDNDEFIVRVKHHKERRDTDEGFRALTQDVSGLNQHDNSHPLDFFDPFRYGNPIASGDINNDHYPDLLFPVGTEINVYGNDGDGSFTYLGALPSVNGNLVMLAAFVDVNNDGWQDVFASLYGGVIVIYLSDRGDFSDAQLLHVPEGNRIGSISVSFADWDHDDDLDFMLGNWSTGELSNFATSRSHNTFVENRGSEFNLTLSTQRPGETLAIMLSDFDRDGFTDAAIGNDVEVEDIFYRGTIGGFELIEATSETFPITTAHTMSYESADFNNDLLPDLFATDMKFDNEDVDVGDDYCKLPELVGEEANCRNLLALSSIINQGDATKCRKYDQVLERTRCVQLVTTKLAVTTRNPALCELLSPDQVTLKHLCENNVHVQKLMNSTEYSSPHNQTSNNVMLYNTDAGKFVDVSGTVGVDASNWSWSGRAADLNNDEWQDLYIVNGFAFSSNAVFPNRLYMNQKGERFDRSESQFGLDLLSHTASYTYADIDQDGDLDIVLEGYLSGPVVYVNQESRNSSVTFSLRDDRGNSFCIGCKVIIEYGTGNHQYRELKLGSGFQSFDSPSLHFGLGDYDHIDRVTVEWSTGGSTDIRGPLRANNHYLIQRKSE